MNEMRTSACLFLAGAVVGSVGAVLMAPRSGRKTRRLLRRKFEEGQEQVSEMADHVSGFATNLRETGNEIWCKGQKIVRDAERMFA